MATLLSAQQPPATSLLTAASLPGIAERLVQAGMPESDLRTALLAMRDRNVPSAEAATLLKSEVEVAESDRGPHANFGAFVQQQLAEGKRGQALAQAIHDHKDNSGTAAARSAAQRPAMTPVSKSDSGLISNPGRAAGAGARPLPPADRPRGKAPK